MSFWIKSCAGIVADLMMFEEHGNEWGRVCPPRVCNTENLNII